MTKSVPKLVLSSSRDIPFSQLVLSQKNVRRVKAGLSIEDLAEDIYRRTLLQSLNVRAMLDDDGHETGQFEVPAGGRRFRALELLVKSKRMAKDQPVPCVVREGGIAEEDSLAENVMREGLHPLDQFRAFSALIEAGLSEEDIAARFFVSVSTVRQRLRLASVAPSLLDVYGEDGMSLEQLMAFSVTDNHARQEQVWEQVSGSQYISAHQIRRLLTEQAIAASDRRVRFIGIDAYTEAGGYVMRDLFSEGDDGWLQDPALVELLVNEKLNDAAQEIGAEGWKWVEAAIDLPYGCERGKRRITGTTVPLTDEEQARLDELVEEYDAIGEEYRDGCDLPDEVDARLTEIDAELTPLTSRPVVYEPEEMARAGVFVSLAHDGRLRIDRGYVRPEDEPDIEDQGISVDVEAGQQGTGPAISVGGQVQDEHQGDDEDDTIRPLPDRLVSELTAVRTVALRNALAQDSQAAFIAVLHALTLSVFRSHGTHGCVQIGVTQAWLGNVAPDLRETPWCMAVQERHEQWYRHISKLLDAPSAVDAGGLVVGVGNRPQAGKARQRHQRRPVPHVHQQHRHPRVGGIAGVAVLDAQRGRTALGGDSVGDGFAVFLVAVIEHHLGRQDAVYRPQSQQTRIPRACTDQADVTTCRCPLKLAQQGLKSFDKSAGIHRGAGNGHVRNYRVAKPLARSGEAAYLTTLES